MIGKQIRSFGQLLRSLKDNIPQKIAFFNGGRLTVGYAIKNLKSFDSHNDTLLFFNKRKGNNSCSFFRDDQSSYYEKYPDLKNYQYVFDMSRGNCYGFFGNLVFLLPDDYDDMFQNMLSQNKKLLAPFLQYNDIDNTVYLFMLFSNSPNLFAWALKVHYNQNVPLTILAHIAYWNEKYGQLVNKLRKGTITAYNRIFDIYEMYDEMVSLRRNKRANDAINLFNTVQKKMLKSIELTDTNIFVLNRFYYLSETKRQNFVRKMSTIEDVNEIMSQMAFLINLHFEWNRNSFISFLNNCEKFKYEIVYDDNNIVVVKCDDYETIKQIAKTTNWCISKNKTYWNQYMCDSNNTQFILLNFNLNEDDEHSIIGFTKHDKFSITHAHSFTNSNLMSNDVNSNIRSFRNISNKNILEILNELDIPSHIYMTKYDYKYEWNRKSFIKFLDYATDCDYDILLDEGDKFVFQTTNNNVRFIFNDNYNRVVDYRNKQSKHFVFVDFSLSMNDSNRIIFSLINKNSSTCEENPTNVLNINCKTISTSFDGMLNKFGLPYDSICRIKKYNKMVSHAMYYMDIELLDSYLSNDEFKKFAHSGKYLNNQDDFYMSINRSIFEIGTLDIIYVIYNNGLKLNSFISESSIFSIVNDLIHSISSYGKGKLPSDYEIENLYTNKIRAEKRILVGYFLALDMIIHNEDKLDYNFILRSCIGNLSRKSELLWYIVDFIFSKVSFSSKNKVNDMLIDLFVSSNRTVYLDLISKMESLHDNYKKIIESKVNCVSS